MHKEMVVIVGVFLFAFEIFNKGKVFIVNDMDSQYFIFYP